MKTGTVKKYGDWALITGASSGIGEAFARYLAGFGFNTILISNEETILKKVCGEIENIHRTRTIALPGDLSDQRFLEQIVQVSQSYHPGIIVNSAGYGLMGYFIQHSFEDYHRMSQVNDEAALFLTHFFCKEFYIRRAKGAIINISSANADFYRGIPFSSVYSALKSMIKNISEGVYYEMKPFGIDIISVSPGPTKTSFQQKANTNTLSFCETPGNVVKKTFKYLGKKPAIMTNNYTKLIIMIYRLLPLSQHGKMAIRAWIFKNILGKKECINLDNITRQASADASTGE
jgi:short-subunit dehydrogenase